MFWLDEFDRPTILIFKFVSFFFCQIVRISCHEVLSEVILENMEPFVMGC